MGVSVIIGILFFYENNFLQGSTLYASPMLLQFICVLVENDPSMDLTRNNVPRGEFTLDWYNVSTENVVKAKVPGGKKDEFVQVLIKIGKFASKPITAKQNCFQRSH